MAFLDRLLRGGRNRAHAEGIALLEDGRYAEAVDRLREAAHGRGEAASSIAAYHFRLALVAEGRRLLRAGDPGHARAQFAEATELWPVYPDLQCLLGAARLALGAWDGALGAARAALRTNPDYVEARLLEAAALQGLGRSREAAEALNALAESGRRVEHWLVGRLARADAWSAETVPPDLAALVAEAAAGVSEKEEVAAAVALCRAGRWDEGLERFQNLVERRPRYPDYRTRLAATLFQVGRNDEALTEVEAALALNEAYRSASDLKALILADGGGIRQARLFLEEADQRRGEQRREGGHADLFGAYLRGVLRLLTGEPQAVAPLLAPWGDLGRTFARAELLLAAADDLTGRPEGCGRRLEGLAAEWKAEPVYAWLLAGHLLARDRPREATAVLPHWPAATDRGQDWRPLYLEGCAALAQGRVPALPEGVVPDAPADSPPGAAGPPLAAAAWSFLRARAALLQGDAARCFALCGELEPDGATAPLVALRTRAACALPDAGGGWQPPPALPDQCLGGRVQLHLARGEAAAAAGLLAAQARLHPEDLRVCWLSPAFWLEPVRGWVG
ncbi:MAG: tetratricopeptide repeat protein [Candidatus Krumholzibacteriia bacterium]